MGSCSGEFRCLLREDGSTLWSFDTREGEGGSQFHGDIVLDEELVVVGTDGSDGGLWAFERETGGVRWKLPAGQGIATDIAVLDDRFYVASLEQRLLCVAPNTGEIVWSYQADGADAGEPGLMTPVGAGDTIYWVSHGAEAFAFEARTGRIRWRRRLSAPVRTNALLLGEELLVGTEDGLLHRLDRETGETADLYTVPGTPWGDIVAAGSTLLVFVDWMRPFGELLGLDAVDGQLRWSAAPPDTSMWTTKRPFVMDERVLVGNERGEAFAIDLEDGSATALFELGSAVRSFAWTDRALYVGALDGTLRAYRR